jgi:hypothetical protein
MIFLLVVQRMTCLHSEWMVVADEHTPGESYQIVVSEDSEEVVMSAKCQILWLRLEDGHREQMSLALIPPAPLPS